MLKAFTFLKISSTYCQKMVAYYKRSFIQLDIFGAVSHLFEHQNLNCLRFKEVNDSFKFKFWINIFQIFIKLMKSKGIFKNLHLHGQGSAKKKKLNNTKMVAREDKKWSFKRNLYFKNESYCWHICNLNKYIIWKGIQVTF